MSDEEFSLKDRAVWFLSGVTIAVIGLSVISISLYSASSPPGWEPWTLTNYFQVVFGFAGVIVGFITTIAGAVISAVSFDPEGPDSDGDSS